MKRFLGALLLCGAVAACNGDEGQGAGKDNIVKLGGLSSKAPSSWKQEEPILKLRTYQFKLPKAAGDTEDAELVVFYFDGGGGSADDNIKRWKSMFTAPKGKTIDDVSKVEKFKVGPASVTYVDVAGDYLFKSPGDPKAKGENKTDFRRLGVIFEWPAGPYFITLTGPARTMEQHKKSFDDWLKNFK